MAYAEVIFNLPVNHPFTYRIPEELQHIRPGFRVLAPFGKRTLNGVVTRIITKSSYPRIRDLIDTPDSGPLVSEAMLELTRWIADYYLSSWGQALQLVLPKGSDRKIEEIVELGKVLEEKGLTEKQRELFILIGSDPGRSKDYYRKKFGQSSFYTILRKLQESDRLQIHIRMTDGTARTLYRQFVHIPADYPKRKNEYADFLKYIEKKPHVDDILRSWAGKEIKRTDFLSETKMAVATLQKMSKLGICVIKERPVMRRPSFEYSEKNKVITLTDRQRRVINTILEGYKERRFSSYLLHGVTGSGKTQVYIEVLREVLRQGQNAIILIPEIALTPQTVGRFKSAFGEEVAVFHSRMSTGERYDAWMSCYQEEVRIVIGPRSALFVPLTNIGLIIVDEEHEASYKQNESQPRYHARDVALYWARMNNAIIILGSATPSLESYYNARNGKYRLLEIPERVENFSLPEVCVIDSRSLREKDDSGIFSTVLLDKMRDRLDRNEQVILLQNRRGHASFLQCKRCGYIALCPKCELSLTYHSFNETVQCHYCGYTEEPAAYCPGCGGEQIRQSGPGTQKIEQEMERLFPDATVLRMDLDTTRGKNSYDRILQRFGRGEADILLGTQMVAKGLDFPNVTLVGVISADIGLSLPDFRAAERVFQLMMQVGGRSGRSSKKGEVVIQSANVTHYAIKLAQTHDFLAFYNQEIRFRQALEYPPYSRLIKILVIAENLNEVIALSRTISTGIRRRLKDRAQLIGPAPDMFPRLNNRFRWQINLKLPVNSPALREHIKSELRGILEPLVSKPKDNAQVHADVDPFSL